jgi:hypothetical protein
MVVYAHHLGNQRQLNAGDISEVTGRKWPIFAGWSSRNPPFGKLLANQLRPSVERSKSTPFESVSTDRFRGANQRRSPHETATTEHSTRPIDVQARNLF